MFLAYPPAKKRKHVPDDIEALTGYSRKEWQVVSIMVELLAVNDMFLNNGVTVDDFYSNNEPEGDYINIGSDDKPSRARCPYMKDALNNNKIVDDVGYYTLTELAYMSTNESTTIGTISDDNIHEIKINKNLCIAMNNNSDATTTIDYEKTYSFHDISTNLSLCVEQDDSVVLMENKTTEDKIIKNIDTAERAIERTNKQITSTIRATKRVTSSQRELPKYHLHKNNDCNIIKILSKKLTNIIKNDTAAELSDNNEDELTDQLNLQSLPKKNKS
ncbi:hypothetical protein HCN44_008725 [Aphidius gifuensis]|uniref:Uncharacterized protein n=1 Tax=Aphidius gifuensis TaxID=684658 RepID=A0A834XQ24_APHGI|nr:hypothetical protein HCN44_008725 [Aphidius gifuensis]